MTSKDRGVEESTLKCSRNVRGDSTITGGTERNSEGEGKLREVGLGGVKKLGLGGVSRERVREVCVGGASRECVCGVSAGGASEEGIRGVSVGGASEERVYPDSGLGNVIQGIVPSIPISPRATETPIKNEATSGRVSTKDVTS
ncbi:hypothetical protein ACH5RR_013267 [Cinchona calisaya]|uniref:Uncharacterized protein n=1 Tax=Cinchona calisaya TaxID=153742 RepID=A0ABD3A2Y3_9GENT